MFNKNLKFGPLPSEDIKQLQRVLKVLPIDGYYGLKTARAVEAFQSKYAIPFTAGLSVGPITRAKLNELFAVQQPKDWGLRPLVNRKKNSLIYGCGDVGQIIAVTSGIRTVDAQNVLYNQPHDGIDNDKDGIVDESDEKVTNAKGGCSFHNYGVAFDICFIENGKATWPDPSDPRWLIIEKIGNSLGLEHGDRGYTDLPHFQCRLGYSLEDFINNKVDYKKYD